MVDLVDLYANSFIESAIKLNKNIENAQRDVMKINEELKEALGDLYFEEFFWNTKEGREVGNEVKNGIQDEFLSAFFAVVFKNNDSHILSDIAQKIELKNNNLSKKINILVPKNPSKDDEKKLKDHVIGIFGDTTNINFIVKEDLISGFLIKTDSFIVDCSFSSRLERMKTSSTGKLNFKQ